MGISVVDVVHTAVMGIAYIGVLCALVFGLAMFIGRYHVGKFVTASFDFPWLLCFYQ